RRDRGKRRLGSTPALRGSLRVTSRMLFEPLPGGTDDRFGIRKIRAPAKVGSGARRICDENRWITWPALALYRKDSQVSDSFDLPDQIPNGKPCARPEVEAAVADLINLLECQQMGLRQIDHMNVVANACAIRSGIVTAVDRERIGSIRRRAEDERYHMPLRTVVFANLAGSSGSIEETKPNRFQPIGLVIVIQSFLEPQFGIAVRAD